MWFYDSILKDNFIFTDNLRGEFWIFVALILNIAAFYKNSLK